MANLTQRPGDLLVLIDIQIDFCPGGALAVPEGDQVVPIANRLAGHFSHVVLTQDWHPKNHRSFAGTHPGRQAFDTSDLGYGTQVLWPDHCVQGSSGAAFHPDLAATNAELVLRKGFRPEIDSYSAFFENDRKTPTGLGGYVVERGFQRVFLVGLATDFCVAFTAEDARRCGLEAVVLLDGCRAIDQGGSLDAALRRMRTAGVTFGASQDVLG